MRSALLQGTESEVAGSLRRGSSLWRDPSERLPGGAEPGHLGRTGQVQSGNAGAKTRRRKEPGKQTGTAGHHRTELLRVSTNDIWDQLLLLGRGCPVLWRMSLSVPGLCLLVVTLQL